MQRSLARLALGVTFACAPLAAFAQVTTVDEGSFTITRQGTRIGREEFRIVRQPSAGGTEYVASGLAVYGDQRIRSALQTDPKGIPLRYQVVQVSGGDTLSKLTATVVHGRLSAQVRTSRGEAASEFATSDGTVIVDDEIFHQYYFLSLGDRLSSATTELSLLTPRRNAQSPVRVTKGASETIDVGGQRLAATRLTVAPGGAMSADVWVDASGRVLKVSVPSRGTIAVRDDPPTR